MSIKKYTNFEAINSKADNEGKFIQNDDFLVISNAETENVDFGDCRYDVMEVSVYDINNNLLPHKSGKNVAFIRSGDIKNYMYNITKKNIALPDGQGQKELAIDVEKLLNDLGFYNGILRINVNFVRSRVGTENEMKRVWVQEISPSRKEIRILPLKTQDKEINQYNSKELQNLKNLNKDFKYYKKSILDSLYSFENKFLTSIDSSLETKYGKDYFNILKKDFGLARFADFRSKIYEDFVTSVTYYLENKNYDIEQSNFGRNSEVRFLDCDQYDFDTIITEMQKILFKCVSYNSYFLKRRDLTIKSIPKEFQAVDITPDVTNVLNVMEPEQTKVEEIRIQSLGEGITFVPEPITEVVTPQNSKVFYYEIQNKSSVYTMLFKFVNSAGVEVQKYLSPGKVEKICAFDETISASPATTISGYSNSNYPALGKRKLLKDDYAVSDDLNDYSIKQGENCNTVDVSDTAPIIQPVAVKPETPRVTIKPTRQSTLKNILENIKSSSLNKTTQKPKVIDKPLIDGNVIDSVISRTSNFGFNTNTSDIRRGNDSLQNRSSVE
jgi:hypothetical protein